MFNEEHVLVVYAGNQHAECFSRKSYDLLLVSHGLLSESFEKLQTLDMSNPLMQ